jgi:uracil phosphoribosyltransferase
LGKVHVLDHPLIQHKLTLLRDRNTGTKAFRELVNEVATLMAYEITRHLPLQEVTVETPVATATSKVLSGKKLGLVPILRAGLGMVEGILNLVPTASVGHIGLYRDSATLQPVPYYSKMPTDMAACDLIVIDPMLATGGSATEALRTLKERGSQNMKLMCLLASPPGIKRVHQDHPDVDIYVAAIDDRLDEKGYIVPGLGDAGDRLFGTG